MISYLLLTVVSFSQPVSYTVHDSLESACVANSKASLALLLKIEAKMAQSCSIVGCAVNHSMWNGNGGVTEISINSISCRKITPEPTWEEVKP